MARSGLKYRSISINGSSLVLSADDAYPLFSANKNFFIKRIEMAEEWGLADDSVARAEEAISVFDFLEAIAVGEGKKFLGLKSSASGYSYRFVIMPSGNLAVFESKPDDIIDIIE